MTNVEKLFMHVLLTNMINELYDLRLELKQLKSDYYEDEDELETESDFEISKENFIRGIDFLIKTDD